MVFSNRALSVLQQVEQPNYSFEVVDGPTASNPSRDGKCDVGRSNASRSPRR